MRQEDNLLAEIFAVPSNVNKADFNEPEAAFCKDGACNGQCTGVGSVE